MPPNPRGLSAKKPRSGHSPAAAAAPRSCLCSALLRHARRRWRSLRLTGRAGSRSAGRPRCTSPAVRTESCRPTQAARRERDPRTAHTRARAGTQRAACMRAAPPACGLSAQRLAGAAPAFTPSAAQRRAQSAAHSAAPARRSASRHPPCSGRHRLSVRAGALVAQHAAARARGARVGTPGGGTGGADSRARYRPPQRAQPTSPASYGSYVSYVPACERTPSRRPRGLRQRTRRDGGASSARARAGRARLGHAAAAAPGVQRVHRGVRRPGHAGVRPYLLPRVRGGMVRRPRQALPGSALPR